MLKLSLSSKFSLLCDHISNISLGIKSWNGDIIVHPRPYVFKSKRPVLEYNNNNT